MKTYDHRNYEINVNFGNGETAFIAEDSRIGGLYTDTSSGEVDELVSLLRHVADEIERQDPRASVP